MGRLRRLPIAYGAYCLAALALPLSYPVTPQPLAVAPPLRGGGVPDLHVGGDVAGAPAPDPARVASMAVLLGLFTAEFATWRFVA